MNRIKAMMRFLAKRIVRVKSTEVFEESNMYRVAVIGNCQADGVAAGLRFLLKNSYVKSFISWETTQWFSTEEELLADLKSFDFIFLQNSFGGWVTPEFAEKLSSYPMKIVNFPTLTFFAFHPDLIYINLSSGGFHSGPVGAYNSAICFFAFQMGLNTEQTFALFNESVYERLGYFSMWDSSVKDLEESANACDLSLVRDLHFWVREGCFMYSINHAKILPLVQLSEKLAKKSGMTVSRDMDLNYIEDIAQKDAIWPVYPEVAKRFGEKGSYVFKKPDYMVQNQFDKFFDLHDFVIESFKSFSYFPRNDLQSDRVSNWLNDPELTQWIKSQC